MHLPNFKYHPDPITTGSIIKSTKTCQCCRQARGYICTSTLYATTDVAFICPWCVSSGEAAQKYNGSFVDALPLIKDHIASKIIAEVTEKTPGFISWQQERWLSHCNDACEFHGDATPKDLENLKGEKLQKFLREEMIKSADWKSITQYYQPGGNPAVYKFICRHCRELLYYMDFS